MLRRADLIAALPAAFALPAAHPAPEEQPVCASIFLCAHPVGEQRLVLVLRVPLVEAREVSPPLDPAGVDAYHCGAGVPA